ncbi:MAG: hypothetical protein NUV74_18385, partial [Candidatus Brocadiaceae bacterium]|nr:hypothetical protein [Candidatus Brocadiaceae bacterium]
LWLLSFNIAIFCSVDYPTEGATFSISTKNSISSVLFIDSVHPTQATKITSGWIRKGVEKMIATVDFLKAIEAAHPASTKIHIIADGGGAHTSNEVGLFLSEANAINRLFLDETYGIKLPGKR